MKNTLFCLLIAICPLVHAQKDNSILDISKNDTSFLMRQLRSYSDSYAEMLNCVPPSPEVLALFKFVDNPVSHSTGIVDINIPLYTIKCGDLQLPITINYHNGGRKYADMTGAVGLGWVLNAGGVISRTVFGFPDEEAHVPINLKESKSLSVKNDYEYIAGLFYRLSDSRFGKNEDSEYDIFSYLLPSMSGKFVLYNGSPYLLTLNSVKIQMQGDINTSRFILTGENGTKYIFSDGETSRICTPNYNGYNTKTAWYLSEICSADGKHVIKLTYEDARLVDSKNGTYQYLINNECLYVKDSSEGSYTSGSLGIPVESKFNNIYIQFSSKRLKEIDFGAGKVVFDIETLGGKVNRMYVKDAVGTIVQTYSFAYSYLDKTILNNYKLDKLTSNSSSETPEVFNFEYYPTSDSFNPKQCDYWGYINGNTSFYCIPSFTVKINTIQKTVGSYDVTREPNVNKTHSGMLKKIVYPTGGSSEYIYEGNSFRTSSGTLRNGPGIRIKQIKTIDNLKQVQIRTYDYSSIGGSIMSIPDMRYWGSETIHLDVTGTINYPSNSKYYGSYRQRVFPSDFPNDISYYGNQPVFYSNVIEYKGDENDNIGKTEYSYSDPNNDSYLSNIPSPSYPVYSYPQYYPLLMPKSFESDNNSRNYKYTYQFGSFWKQCNLASCQEFAKIGNGYRLIKSTRYQYKEIKGDPINGLKIFKYIQLKDDSDQSVEEFLAKDFGLPVFLFTTYYITRGRQLLSSISETEYIANDSAISSSETEIVRNFNYNSRHLLNEESILNSTGMRSLKKIKYSSDDEYKDEVICKKMLNRNMIDIPVEHIYEQNDRAKSESVVYKDYNGIIKPAQIIAHNTGGEAEVRIQYLKYDTYGNPIYIIKDEVTKVVFIWGYKGEYPVAKIENATYEEVQRALGCAPDLLSSSLEYDNRIEGLRTHKELSHAHVTIYKYKPLVGLVAITSPLGITTNYTYDSSNRLKRISMKEMGGIEKILESYDYHYQGNLMVE